MADFRIAAEAGTTYNLKTKQSDPWLTLRASAIVDTLEEAQAIKTTFPKSCKVRAMTLGTFEGTPGTDSYRRIEKAVVDFHVKLGADLVNGGYNETGIRRYRTLRKTIAAQGHSATWTKTFENSLSEQGLEQAIA